MASEIENLDLIRNSMFDSGKEVIKNNPSIDNRRDIRVLTFFKMSEVVTTARLGLVFIQTFKKNPELLKDNPALQNSFDQHPMRFEEFERFIKATYIQNIFIILEASLRNFLRELSPHSCSKGTSSFKNIYEKLFKELQLNNPLREKFFTVLDFWREIRNSVHNNFVYFSSKEESITISYKGLPFLFENGKPVSFLKWELLYLLTCDLEEIFIEIINQEAIKKIHLMIDPANIYTAS
ncbi:MAG: hypothetical protein G3M78_06480 [Candidatus Nitrohelix vancouverensis]|uniref:Cthe-2314-like HEPN domain-containing protein n=1 Tax=Candidatus Nitrohelix vancouverensis TaxID=2705534 RepID=A0A7T0C218_9BACT|nr:MAG: hypothetical protein G3M78_06480 [Candidatus Nitrohelix vancouverensis]